MSPFWSSSAGFKCALTLAGPVHLSIPMGATAASQRHSAAAAIALGGLAARSGTERGLQEMGHAAVPKRCPRRGDVPACTQAMGAQMGGSGLTALHDSPPAQRWAPLSHASPPAPPHLPYLLPRPRAAGWGRSPRDERGRSPRCLCRCRCEAERGAAASGGGRRGQRQPPPAGRPGLPQSPPAPPPPKPGGGTVCIHHRAGCSPAEAGTGILAEAILRLHESIPSLAVAWMEMGTPQLLAFS